ncbi:MAG TPA: site-2 protease family protein [Anaeromyxobacteraceae bacterium]|nr:site-2 protease family protein [Anaeromyxobacteraceae bacterium]
MDLQGIGAFILVVGGLVFVHELGHFLFAKWLGVKVLRFSIGFGPRLLWWTVGETEYRISALPLGGYVKMAGDVPGEDPAPEDRGRGFYEQQPWKRIAIGVAGPASNFAFPILLFVALGLAQNGEWTAASAIGTVAPGSAAERAGLQPDDRILSVAAEGRPAVAMRWWADLVDAISTHPGVPLRLLVERGGRRVEVAVTPEAEERPNGVEQERRGVLGIMATWPAAIVAPVAPGTAGPVAPFDEVTKVAGRPVAHFGELSKAFASAGCAPVDLEVRRGPPEARATVRLAGVPTCADGGPSVLAVDPVVAAVVARVDEGSPAAEAGLARGDVITALDGRPVRSFRDLAGLEQGLKAGVPLELRLAGGRVARVVPREELRRDPVTGEKVPRLVLGLYGERAPGGADAALEVAKVRYARGIGEIAREALQETWRITRITALGIAGIATGKLSHRSVGGIITLFDQSRDAAAAGWGTLFFWMALVSVNLGLMNLMPIPVLDGGHVVAALVEQVTRRPLSLRVREVATYVGLVLLGLLMILAFRNDIARLMG